MKSEPKVGMKLPFERSSTDLRMTGSGSLAPAYEVEHEGLEFTICAYKDKLVHYVDTDDPNFRTPERITAGESLKNVLEISKGRLIREPGWAFYVRLKSVWNAAFLQGYATEGELSPDAKVRFLFKRHRSLFTSLTAEAAMHSYHVSCAFKLSANRARNLSSTLALTSIPRHDTAGL